MRKQNKGFTLVELLVVMAIIAILASIVVPNLATWIGRGRVTKAVSEIQSIELALSAMLADTERSSLNELFDANGVRAYLDARTGSNLPTAQRVAEAQTLYTRATYALLRDGRAALTGTDSVIGAYAPLYKQDLVRKLGTNYLPELTFDPWGNLYNIYPGPWDSKNGPIIFRTYQKPDSASGDLPGKGGSLSYDVLTYGDLDTSGALNNANENATDPDTGLAINVGYPANTRKAFYIWSSGADLISSQAVYQAPANPSQPPTVTNQQYNPQAELNYNSQLTVSQIGGGDDINNWDSGSSWAPFYN